MASDWVTNRKGNERNERKSKKDQTRKDKRESKRIKENQREWNRNGGIGGVGWMLIETDLETGQSSQIGGVFDADIGRVTSAGSVNIFGSFGGR